jgi:hypothetical protein
MPDIYGQTITGKLVKLQATTDVATTEKDGLMSKEDKMALEQLKSGGTGGGSGGGTSVNGKVYFVDQQTGLYYVLKVYNGDLTMEETTDVPTASGYISLVDENTLKNYELKVVDGKLTMSEVV